jgi:Tfp pilus assembly protein PilZ
MTEERRSAPRARISGARVTYESAAGDHVETDALNIGPEGLFVTTAKPLAVGKRISIEIQVAGEPPWSALGRIVWVRQEADGPQRPSGMGVKLIDVEDAMVAAMDRLVLAQASAEQAEVVRAAAAASKREATVLGVGAQKETAPAVPIVSVAPRERTILGVGLAPSSEESASAEEPSPQRVSSRPHKPAAPREPSGAREPSVVVDLVDSEKKGAAAPRDEAATREASSAPDVPTVVKRRRGAGWFLVFVFLLLAAAAAYALMGTDLERIQRLTGTSPPPPPPSHSPTVSPQASTAHTLVSWPTANQTASAPASARASASASATPAGHASASSTPTSTSTAGGHGPPTANQASEPAEPKKASTAPPSSGKPPKKLPPPDDNPY